MERIREMAGLPFMIKGIQTVEDAEIAVALSELARDGTAACAVRFPHDRHVFVAGRSCRLR